MAGLCYSGTQDGQLTEGETVLYCYQSCPAVVPAPLTSYAWRGALLALLWLTLTTGRRAHICNNISLPFLPFFRYALPPDKQQAVAQETRKVWCTLAERLGIFSLKASARGHSGFLTERYQAGPCWFLTNSDYGLLLQSELEDLCFAVLQPRDFVALRDAVFEFCQIPTAKAEVWT